MIDHLIDLSEKFKNGKKVEKPRKIKSCCWRDGLRRDNRSRKLKKKQSFGKSKLYKSW